MQSHSVCSTFSLSIQFIHPYVPFTLECLPHHHFFLFFSSSPLISIACLWMAYHYIYTLNASEVWTHGLQSTFSRNFLSPPSPLRVKKPTKQIQHACLSVGLSVRPYKFYKSVSPHFIAHCVLHTRYTLWIIRLINAHSPLSVINTLDILCKIYIHLYVGYV